MKNYAAKILTILTLWALVGAPMWMLTQAQAGCVIPGATTVVVSANWAPLAADTGKIYVSSGSTAITMTLPATPPTTVWRVDVIVAGSNTVTINPNGATLDGASSNEVYTTGTITEISTDGTNYYSRNHLNPQAYCIPGTFSAQTDAATVTWAIGSSICGNASLTFTVHSGSRTLNLTGLVSGGSYVLWLKQDGTGGEGLTLGTGCTWKVSGGGSGAVSLSTGANAIDVLAFIYDGTNCYANLNKNFN